MHEILFRVSYYICATFLVALLVGCDRSTHDAVKPKEAQVTIECEQYRVTKGLKVDRTIFTIAFAPGEDHLAYQKIAGPDWIIPTLRPSAI
jgi:hypothetical protein